MHTDGDELAGVEDEAPDTGEPEESVTDTQIVATARLPEDEDSGDWYDDDVDAADSAGQPDDHDAPVARAETGDAPIAHTETGDAPIAQTDAGSAPTQTSDAWLDAPDDEGLWVERALGLETELATAASDADRVAILLEIATIWRDQLAERDAAASAFERVLEIDARNDEAFSGLESIYSLQRESAKLVTLLLHGAEHSESVADRVEHMQRVAHLYEQHGQPDKALLVLDAALDVAPDNPPLAAEIARLRDTAAALYEQQGGPPTPDPLVQREAERAAADPLALLQQQLDQAEDDAARAELCEQIAALWLRDRRDPERAADSLRRALRFEPGRGSVLDELERLHRDAGDLATFAQLLDRQAHEAQSPQAERRLVTRLSELYEGPLDDAPRALDTLERIHAMAPDDQQPLDRIVRLARQMGRWDRVVKALNTLARFPRSETEQAGLLYQIGSIYQHQLGDIPSAEQHYGEALDIDPSHIPSLSRMGDIYRESEAWSKWASLLQRAEAYCGQPVQRADLLFQAGSIYLEQLRDRPAAAELLERARKLDPHHRAAVQLLADIYWQDERPERLEPLLEQLLRTCADDATAERLDLALKLAEVAERLDKLDAALTHYRLARTLDPDSVASLLRLADIAYRTADWAAAHAAYGELLQRQSELEPDLVRQSMHRLAEAARSLDRPDEAIDALRAILSREDDREARQSLADLLLQVESWSEAAELREQMLENAPDADVFDLSVALGDLYSERLDRPDRAQEHYERALTCRPDSRATLHRLLDLCSTTKQWARTIEVCAQLAELETDGKLRAKYHYAAAVIARDELHDGPQALELFNQTLDADPERIKAFREIDELCSSKGQWKALAKNYSRMLRRLPKKGYRKLKARLWQNLGEVLRSQLHDNKGAIEAFSAAISLDPADVELRHILLRLYLEDVDAYRTETLRTCHELLRIDPAETEPYHALRRVYLGAEQFDQAWCICAALTFLKHASKSERSLFRQYRARTLLRASAQLTDELWQRVLNHSAQDRHLNAILALVALPVGDMTARTHADFGIRRADRADLNDASQPLLVVARYVSAVLAVPHPDVHIHPDQPGAIMMAHTEGTPSFVAGAHLLGRSSRREMAFILAKQLTFLRPEYFLRYALTGPERLEVLLQAVYEVCGQTYGGGASQTKLVGSMARGLQQRLHRAEIEQLGQLVERLASKGPVDLLKWWNAAELTADRVGLLLCNDLEVATRMIGAEPGGTGGLSRSERVKQLVQFICSEPFFLLRERLGLTIAQQASVGESRSGRKRAR